MQLIMNDWFKAARKKLCAHSDKYTFVRNGKTFSGTRCNPYTGPATSKQMSHREKFKKASEMCGTISESEELKAAWHERYMADKAARKTTALSLRGYVVQQYFANKIAENGQPVD